MTTDTRGIETVKDPAVRGYASVGVVIKPWIAYVDGKKLVDRRGNVRRFSTERAARSAAQRSS